MQRPAFLAAIALLTAACDGRTPDQSAGSSVPPAPATRSAPPVAPSASAPGIQSATGRAVDAVDVETQLYEFAYSYPREAAMIPRLKSLLDTRQDEARRELEYRAAADQREAAKDGYPYRKHSSMTKWEVVTQVPRWLSLSAEKYEYTGGAHGMAFFDSLLWDKPEGKGRKPLDLFISKDTLSRAIRTPFCAALDKEREKRRGEPVDRNSGDQFDECIDPAESTLILGSTNELTFDRIGVLVEPYAAGAYAEGTFEITLPVTAAVIAAVKPQYRADFSTPR